MPRRAVVRSEAISLLHFEWPDQLAWRQGPRLMSQRAELANWPYRASGQSACRAISLYTQ
ncbi:hypothetical protein BDI4_20080 [Burkholderia diffusa]|nr:hypothetical protein BDI4_20080 [Burkholderia diffusa]